MTTNSPNTYPDIQALRESEPSILCLGTHAKTIQSILDFDTLIGRTTPSIIAIIAGGHHSERYFFAGSEVVVPVYPSLAALPSAMRARVNLFLNLLSGRRVLEISTVALETLPNLLGGAIFAERFPERFALSLAQTARKHSVWLLGAASIGLIMPGHLKLGPIGGTTATQLLESRLDQAGSIAVISLSGGVTNELIDALNRHDRSVSFAASAGGERWPLTEPADLLLAAQADPSTQAIVYYGELGGRDEFRMADLIRSGQITKPVLAYIAGRAAELFPEPPQFGHAGAIAKTEDESADAKSTALRQAGATVARTLKEYVSAMNDLPKSQNADQATPPAASDINQPRSKGLFASSISRDLPDGRVEVAGHDLLELAKTKSLSAIIAMMWLGQDEVSPELEQCLDYCLKVLSDHGPYQSGAVNTIVTARAGQPLVSALSAGLLTIGPRFGGAINEAARTWLTGVETGTTAAAFVTETARNGQRIAGIGHRKYSRQLPDPRLVPLLEFANKLKNHPFLDFALGVEDVTTRKGASLILNVDGAIAATLLDLLHDREHYSTQQLAGLVEVEFFNAIFIFARSIGLIAHYLDQRRLDEGLFRLDPTDVAFVDQPET